jgi:hypothetical protein
VITTSGTYPWSFVTQIFHSGQPSHGGDRNIFEVMTSTSPNGTLHSVAYWLAVVLYQWNPYRNHKLWNIVSSDIYFICMCCSRKGRTIRPRRSYLYFTAFNVPWKILAECEHHDKFQPRPLSPPKLVHTLVRKTFPTPTVHTFIAKAKWKSGFITKKDVLPGVKPPTTACASPG